MLLKNHWYVGAWSSEITNEPMARTLLNEAVVFYRTTESEVVAMADRCPHRSLPLSMGKVVGDNLQCHYHGLQFAASGQCVRIPGQEKIPPGAGVRTYPTVEKFGWVWIWMGEADQAEPNDIPDFHWLDDPAWGARGTRVHVKANWQLIVDNLLDLTHLAFVHATTIGNAAVADAAAVKVDRRPDGVLVTRWMIDQPAPPTYVRAGGFTSNVDRWQFIDFTPPANLRLHVGANPTGSGAPDGNFSGGINMRNLNAITPETEDTTHYFWAQAHDFDVNNSELTTMLFEQVNTAFLEDVAVFEAQQQVLTTNPEAPCIDINADSGAIQARLILDKLHLVESAKS